MSLREEIWNEVRPLVQDYRLNSEDGNDDMVAGTAGIQSALVQEVAEVIHLVVHLRGDPRTGFRGVNSIAEITSGVGERFETHEIFGRRTRGAPLMLRSPPRNPEVIDRILEGGLDTSRWTPKGFLDTAQRPRGVAAP